METTATHTDTAAVVAAMLTEPTGRNPLDSGGAYGRNFERNAGTTTADWLASERAVWGYGGEYALVNIFHFLNDRLEFDPELQAQFDEFAEGSSEAWLTDMTEFVEAEFPDALSTTVNTYNHENNLSQDIQYMAVDPEGSDYIYGNDVFVLLQVHGGCDARGGYTAPKAFRVLGEVGLFDDNDVEFSCTGTDPKQFETLPGWPDATRTYHNWSYRGEWIDSDGSCCEAPEFKMNDDGVVPCPVDGCTGTVSPFTFDC